MINELFAKYQFGAIHTADTTGGSHELGTRLVQRIHSAKSKISTDKTRPVINKGPFKCYVTR